MKFIGLIAAIVLTGIAIAPASATPARQSVIDPKLVGTWTRTITKADAQREEAFGYLAGEHCTLTIKQSGSAHIVCPGRARVNFTGPISSAGTNRIDIALGDTSPNAYRWHVSAHLLTLTKLNDTNPDRAAAMQGVWKRK